MIAALTEESCSLVTLPFQSCSWGLPCDLSQLPKSLPLILYLGNGSWDLMMQTYKGSVASH